MNGEGHRAGLRFAVAGIVLWAGLALSVRGASARGATAALGERLFSDVRFVRPPADPSDSAPGVSCRTCHFAGDRRGAGLVSARQPAFADSAVRSVMPGRSDGRSTTPRNSPSLVDSLPPPTESGLLHFDGEFAAAESLVLETFLGRNFGWLPAERAEALKHFARVIRGDDGRAATPELGGFSYTTLLRGTDPAIPEALRLAEKLRFDPATASDAEIVDRCSRPVVAFLRTLQFSRDAEGRHDGSPYDAFLAANRLPRAPRRDQTPAEYGRLLAEQIANLRAPRFIDEPPRALRQHGDQPFRFGELELLGARIFFRGAIGTAQKSGAGNCAECHVPPQFTDFKFHNTGAAQDEYDALHGAGAFARLEIPALAAREADFDRWLPPTPQHPQARGLFLGVPSADASGRTDVGLWNVYGNPDLPAPQHALERLFNSAGTLSRDDVLARTLARFKTSTVRNLGQSAPYLHTGQLCTIEDIIVFYQRMSALAQAGRMRNAPPEFFAMRLAAEDIAPLAAFLRALNEDFEGSGANPTAARAEIVTRP